MNSPPGDRPSRISSRTFQRPTKLVLPKSSWELKSSAWPYSRVQFKPLRGKLWEVKFSSPGGGFRMAYVLVTGDDMVVLHAFRESTQKTPLKDLDLAERRMKEVLNL